MADMTLACGDEADAEHIPGDTDGVAIGEFVEGQFFFADRLAAIADVIFIEEGPVPASQVLQECAWRADIQDAMMSGNAFGSRPGQLNITVFGSADEAKHFGIESISCSGKFTTGNAENDFSCHKEELR